MKSLWKKAGAYFGRMSLVDGVLLIFLLLLFAYMAVQLLMGRFASEDVHSVDIIVRTSAAAIVGYFISSNFAGSQSAGGDTADARASAALPAPAASADAPRSRIGFQAEPETETRTVPERGGVILSSGTPAGGDTRLRRQILVVSVVGFFALAVLLVARNLPGSSPGLTATVSQLRDFLSACIGFLVSCGKRAAG